MKDPNATADQSETDIQSESNTGEKTAPETPHQSPPSPERQSPTSASEMMVELATDQDRETLGIAGLFDPEKDEEQQVGLLQAARAALMPFDKGADIDLVSLSGDAVDYSNKAMRTGNFPTGRYPSPVGYYGFDVKHNLEDETPTTTYSQSKVGKVILKMEQWMYRLRDGMGIAGKPVRQKITGEGFAKRLEENAKAVGQQAYYSLDNEGNLVEKINDLRGGVVLDDLLRLQGRKEEKYAAIQAMSPLVGDALASVAREAERLHREHDRGVGEMLCNDFVLQLDQENGQAVPRLAGIRLALPDVEYLKGVSPEEQKATDLIDLCFSVGSAALQTGDLALARQYIAQVLNNYSDEMVKSFMRALLPTRPRYGYFSNRPRLGFDRVKDSREKFESIRAIIRDLLHKNALQLPQSGT